MIHSLSVFSEPKQIKSLATLATLDLGHRALLSPFKGVAAIFFI